MAASPPERNPIRHQKNGNAAQSGSKPTSGKQDGTDSFSDLGIPEEVLGQLTDPDMNASGSKTGGDGDRRRRVGL